MSEDQLCERDEKGEQQKPDESCGPQRASDTAEEGLLTSETVLGCEVQLTYSPKAHAQNHVLFIAETRLIVGIMKT